MLLVPPLGVNTKPTPTLFSPPPPCGNSPRQNENSLVRQEQEAKFVRPSLSIACWHGYSQSNHLYYFIVHPSGNNIAPTASHRTQWRHGENPSTGTCIWLLRKVGHTHRYPRIFQWTASNEWFLSTFIHLGWRCRGAPGIPSKKLKRRTSLMDVSQGIGIWDWNAFT